MGVLEISKNEYNTLFFDLDGIEIALSSVMERKRTVSGKINGEFKYAFAPKLTIRNIEKFGADFVSSHLSMIGITIDEGTVVKYYGRLIGYVSCGNYS